MTESRLSAVTTAAKALGHPARVRVLAMVSGGPLCVCGATVYRSWQAAKSFSEETP
jgi:hypothetical protein